MAGTFGFAGSRVSCGSFALPAGHPELPTMLACLVGGLPPGGKPSKQNAGTGAAAVPSAGATWPWWSRAN